MAEEILQALRSVHWLASLPDELLQQIATFSTLRSVRTDETIFCQSEPSPFCFGIVRGKISLQYVSRDAAQSPQVVGVLEAGELFGESALFEESPRATMASAVQPGQLVAIFGARWRTWVQEALATGSPSVNHSLQDALAQLQKARPFIA